MWSRSRGGRQISNYGRNKIIGGQAVIWQRWWCSVGAACRVAGYLWSRRLQWLGIGGRKRRRRRRRRLHTLRSGYVPCLLASQPPPPVRGGGGRESFDYFHRLRLIPAKGHCSLWAAQTKRLPANNSRDAAEFQQNISVHTPLSLVDAEDWQQLCLFYQELLLMLHLVQLVAIKLEKPPPHLIELDLGTTEVEQQAVPTTQPSS